MDEAAETRILDGQGTGMWPHENIPARVAVEIQHVQLPVRGELLTEHVRFPEVIARIQKKDQDIAPDERRHMQQRYRLSLKRRAQGDLRPKGIYRPPDNLLWRLGFEFF